MDEERVRTILSKYIDIMADIIMNDGCWENSFPELNGEQWDAMVGLQEEIVSLVNESQRKESWNPSPIKEMDLFEGIE